MRNSIIIKRFWIPQNLNFESQEHLCRQKGRSNCFNQALFINILVANLRTKIWYKQPCQRIQNVIWSLSIPLPLSLFCYYLYVLFVITGETPPEGFMAPKAWKVLVDYYQSIQWSNSHTTHTKRNSDLIKNKIRKKTKTSPIVSSRDFIMKLKHW